MRLLDHLPLEVKQVIDGTSVAITLGAVMSWLPSIASLLTIVWMVIRIWETETIQKMAGRVVKDVVDNAILPVDDDNAK